MGNPVFSKLTNQIASDVNVVVQPLIDQITTASQVLGSTPTVVPGKPSAFLGQENADKLGTQIIYTLPAGALAAPKSGTDWMLGMWVNTGPNLKSAQSETLLCKGGSGSGGGNDRSFFLNERAISPGGLTFGWIMKATAIPWMNNPTPTPNTVPPVEPASPYFILLAQIGDKPYVGYCAAGPSGARIQDTAIRLFTGDTNFGHGSFWFLGKVASTNTMVRTNNVITLTRASGSHGLAVGSSVYLSADETAVNGAYTVATVPSGGVFTVSAPGADQTFTNAGYSAQTAVGNLFNVVGAAEAAFAGDYFAWGGAMSDLFYRTGTVGVPGAFAASMLSGGLIDPTVLVNLANRKIAVSSLPGTDAYSHNLGDLSLPATGTNSTAAPTATGTLSKGPVLRQPEYIRVNPRPHEWPHATVLGKRSGTIRLNGTTNIGIRHIFATVYSNEAMTTIASAKHLVAYPTHDGTFKAVTKDLPIGCGYWVKLESGDNPGVYVVSGPHAVGPVYGVISQSTLNVLFGVTTGTTLAPVAPTTGIFSTLDISGDLTDSGNNYTNQAAWCRATARRVRYAGQVGNGIVGAANKLLTLFNAAVGVKTPLAFANFCTSGHSADNYIHDRKVRRVSIGTFTAGVLSTGTWRPVASPYWSGGSTVSYTKAGAAKLYVNKALVATTDASGNWVGQGIVGTFDKSTCVYSITPAFSGAAEIETTVFLNTTAGGQTQKSDVTLTCFGDETSSAVTGHTLERLWAAKEWGGVTALVYSWENYRVSPLSTMSDSDAVLNTNYIMTQLRARFNSILGQEPPLIVMGDPRTTSYTDSAEHRARKYTRAWAQAQGGSVYYIPGANTATMDTNAGPHAGPNIDGGQYIGEVMAHGLAYLEGLPGAAGEEIVPVSVTRVDSSTVDIYTSKSVSFPSATLVTGLGGEPEGVYFGTVATTLLRIAPAATSDTAEYYGGYTISFPAGTTNVVRVHKDSGTIPSGYWNINYGAPFNKGSVYLTTMALQATAMDNSIFLNTGGFSAPARPGIGIQPSPDAIYCV